LRLAPARDSAVENVEHEGGRRQRRRPQELRQGMAGHVGHGEEHRANAAGGVAQREHVRQVKAANHREMLARLLVCLGRGGGHGGPLVVQQAAGAVQVRHDARVRPRAWPRAPGFAMAQRSPKKDRTATTTTTKPTM
jgi:hypothetical protein